MCIPLICNPLGLSGARALDLTSEATQASSIPLIELAQILDEHKMWVESGGDEGAKADLTGANLAGADLTGVNLQDAILTKAKLTSADLSMANLRGTNLVHADLRNATLLGTELRGANLMGATLYGAEGLWVGRLGGTNLFDALLPESVAEFSNTNPIAEASKVARFFYFTTLAVSAICCLMILFTTDVRLLLNTSALPYISRQCATYDGILSWRSAGAICLVSAISFLAAALVGQYRSASRCLSGRTNARTRRSVVFDGIDTQTFSMAA